MSEKITGPRKVILAGRYTLDPAIDVANPECSVLTYRLTRQEEHLRFRPGKEPTRFVVQHLKRKFKTSVIDTIAGETERYSLTFAASCHLIEIPGEEPMRCDPSELVEWVHGGKIAPESWLDKVFDRFGEAAIEEVGKIAWEMVQLPPGADGPFV